MNNQEKENIREALTAYCENYPSQNRAAESLSGVSAATISTLIARKWEKISDDMFTRIASQIGYTGQDWSIHQSRNFRELEQVLQDAQLYRNVTWVVGDAGCGKTTAAIEYRRQNRNVFYILCSEDMKKSDFVREIAKQVGAPSDGQSLRDTLEYAIGMIGYLNHPLLIFDEGDKLTDSVFNYFISIYNRLENRSGIVFLSTNFIKRRMESGLRYNKKGYKEINSRIGRRFYDLNETSQDDIAAICMANGVTRQDDIKKVLRDAQGSENDLRRVRRVVHSVKRSNERKTLKE